MAGQLGAGRGRIVRQYLAESMLLAAAGSAAGVFCARWATGFLAQFVWTGNIDRAHNVSVDGRVLAFTAAVTAISGVLTGLIPAWRTLRTDPCVALRQSGRGVSGGNQRLGKPLIIVQVALAAMLVLAAALFSQTRRNLQALPLGFNASNLLEMFLINRPGGYTGMDPDVYYPELFQRLSRVPGVRAVASATLDPVLPPFFPDQVVTAQGETASVQYFRIGPDYFRTLEIPLVGRRIRSGARDLTIAGVVRDSEIGSLQNHNPLQLFTSALQENAGRQPAVLLRTAAVPDAALVSRLRQEVEAMGREYPLRIQTVDRAIDRALVKERMLAWLATGLGAAALLLASVGLYGLMSYSVTRRSGEVAIRVAMGARRRTIVRMIVGESLVLLAAGFALSAPGIYGGRKLVSNLLFGFESGGWVAVLAEVAVILTVVALAAAALPAHRASTADPLEALKQV